MHNRLTNLLPPERRRALAHAYYIRLGVVSALILSMLVLAAGVLLIPSYVFLSMNESVKKSHLATIESTMSTADEKNLSARLVALSADATTLIALEHAPSASAILREVLAVTRPGIILSGFSYTTADIGTPGAIMITGIAATRDALRGYQLMLQSAPFARSADLPVSAYAKDSHIPFSITITLAP